jgi:hypothetical protein
MSSALEMLTQLTSSIAAKQSSSTYSPTMGPNQSAPTSYSPTLESMGQSYSPTRPTYEAPVPAATSAVPSSTAISDLYRSIFQKPLPQSGQQQQQPQQYHEQQQPQQLGVAQPPRPIVFSPALPAPTHVSQSPYVAHFYPALQPHLVGTELCAGLDITAEWFCDAEDFRMSQGYRVVRFCTNPQCLFAHSFEDIQLRVCPHAGSTCPFITHCPLAHPDAPHGATYFKRTSHGEALHASHRPSSSQPVDRVDKYLWRKDRMNRWFSRRTQLTQYMDQLAAYQASQRQHQQGYQHFPY